MSIISKKYNDWNKVWRFNCGIAIESNMAALKYLHKANLPDLFIFHLMQEN